MTDAAIIAIAASVLATVQGVSTAWLTHTVNRNACGAEKCLAILAREKNKGETK